jgi:hypothetical protein
VEITGDLPLKGGVLRAVLEPGDVRNQIRGVRFTGPFRDEPAGTKERLESALAGSTIDEAPARIEDFFAQNSGALPGVEPEDFLTVLSLAFMKLRRSISTAPDPSDWKKKQS